MGAIDRRQFLAAAGGLTLGALSLAALPAPPRGFVADTPATTEEARAAGWAVVTDFGAVGDGGSRPLSSRFATLDDARRVYPAATALSDELDGVAIQAAADSGVTGVFYPAGTYRHSTAVVVHSGQRHLGAGSNGGTPTTRLANTRSRGTGLDWNLAHSFRIGDIHPVAMEADRAGVGWAVRTLAAITAGSRTVRLTEPLGDAVLRVGDIVNVRCDNSPVVDGEGLTYDAEQWNRVVAISGDTVTLELPVPWTIVAASDDPTVLAGPRLCVNAGGDYFLGIPWEIVQDVEVGRFALNSAGFSARNGVWRGWFHDLVLVCENMMGINALVLSTVERVSGTWSARMIELKHAGHSSTLRSITGTQVPMPSGSVGVPSTAIDIGEQCYDMTLTDITLNIDASDTVQRRALEVACSGVSVQARLNHLGAGQQQSVWAVKDSNGLARPPTDVSLDLVVRTRPGYARYGVVGYPSDRPSDPVGVTLALDQRTVSGAPAACAFWVATARDVHVTSLTGDQTVAVWSPPGEAPTGCTSRQV
ncbi:hypothetical protein [Actinomycetospora termitidis]|uniref:Pectate lyase superfamily protein domain-containing protein n=1 Tax=Actinomycetospora termitidis TaxID=3053470 RepID=A0ABT7MIL0_9PSEU|nr:hypothetical protein [Actinomycetospora sp. Odt1-22]MDL5159163.1 hypothetical protein [Actinomycetospora sp. Odt1-22]